MAEDFGKKIERFGQDVWKKTTDTVGAIGKSAEVANKNRDLKSIYAEIGKQFYEKHPGQAADEFGALAADAKTLETEIAELEKQILVQRGIKECPSCNMEIPAASAFCPKCGAAQPKVETEPAAEGEVKSEWYCPLCGVKNESSAETCVACGAKRPD